MDWGGGVSDLLFGSSALIRVGLCYVWRKTVLPMGPREARRLDTADLNYILWRLFVVRLSQRQPLASVPVKNSGFRAHQLSAPLKHPHVLIKLFPGLPRIEDNDLRAIPRKDFVTSTLVPVELFSASDKINLKSSCLEKQLLETIEESQVH